MKFEDLMFIAFTLFLITMFLVGIESASGKTIIILIINFTFVLSFWVAGLALRFKYKQLQEAAKDD